MLIKKNLILWILFGILGLIIFVCYYSSAFPSASVDINISRQQAVDISAKFIKDHGFNVDGFDKAVIFTSDFHNSVYLQKTQGIKRTNEYIRDGIPIWFWGVRWFREMDKEGYYVWINPSTGRVDRFGHAVLDDQPGADIGQDEAKAIAERELISRGIDLNKYEIKDSHITKQKNRTDHSFVWERKGFSIGQAKYRIRVNIAGDSVGGYMEFLKVPEDFLRLLEKENTFGEALTSLAGTFIFLFTVFAMIVMVVKKSLVGNHAWRIPVIFAVLVIILKILNFLNLFPLQWFYYPDTTSKFLFIASNMDAVVHSSFVFGAMVFAYCLLAVIMAFGQESNTMPILFSSRIEEREVIHRCLVGYCVAFIFLGYVTVFYLVAFRFFDIWMPPTSYYSDLLATSFPFLFPLTIGFTAAVNEEFTYRMFMGKFLERWCKNRWFMFIIPAVIWAFGHSSYAVYPAYVRGIELTIFGMFLMFVFLRFGIETVLVGHFVINAMLGAIPLLKSHNPLFIFYGILVVGLIALPLMGAMMLKRLKELFFNFFHRRA